MRRPWSTLLRVPLFYKILVANAAIVVAATVFGAALTRQVIRGSPAGLSTAAMVALLALAGVAVTVLVNALIVRLALKPLNLLEQTAEQVQAGDLDARVPYSALLDQRLERLTRTFNAMLDNLESYRERLREVAARALHAEEEERKRIARELHDDTAQTLAALLIRLRILRGTADEAQKNTMLEQFRTEVSEALERVRRFARGLRPPELDELGLVPALESHIRNLAESAQTAVRLEAELLDNSLNPQAELALYRIAQEAISNAVRHSGADEVRVHLTESKTEVSLSVADDGQGFDRRQVVDRRGRGLGLFGMQERAAYVGGRLDITSRPGKGTEIRAIIPVVPGEGRRRLRSPVDPAPGAR